MGGKLKVTRREICLCVGVYGIILLHRRENTLIRGGVVPRVFVWHHITVSEGGQGGAGVLRGDAQGVLGEIVENTLIRGGVVPRGDAFAIRECVVSVDYVLL